MDPFSITTGVVTLLTTCIQVGGLIKDFYDGAAIADVKVKGLLSEVEGFSQVLRIMEETLKDGKIKSSFRATGHMGNHWSNLSTSIKDGQNTLVQLRSTLDKVNKSVSVLNGPRKHARLTRALDEIGMFQQQIRSYRDTSHLSLQIVILWNQATFKKSIGNIQPNLDELHESIRRLAFDINARMITLQTLVESSAKHQSIQTLNNLRNCVQSAVSVVSSASTSLGIDHADHFSVTDGSEFGDCFPSKPSETMRRWVSSNTVYEFEEDLPQTSAGHAQREAPGKNPQRAAEISDTDQTDHSDSDNDVEVELARALLKQGKERLDAKDFGDAERLFRNCLSRSTSSLSSKVEVMTLLVKTYQQQEKWTEARSILVQKIASASRNTIGYDSDVLSDILTLVEILLKKGANKEALLYGRRALKGYRRMGVPGTAGVGKALQLLVTICSAERDVEEQEAYMAMLSNFIQQQVSANDDLAFEALGEQGLSSSNNTSRDLNAEKLALSAYTAFANEQSEKILNIAPPNMSLDQVQVRNILKVQWDIFNEEQRAPYVGKAAHENQCYEDETAMKARTAKSPMLPATTPRMVGNIHTSDGDTYFLPIVDASDEFRPKADHPSQSTPLTAAAPHNQYGHPDGSIALQSAGYPVPGSMGVQGSVLPLTMSAQPGIVVQEYRSQQSFDTTGQAAPPGMKPRITATLWEDEGSLCFVVEAKGCRVARREDNHMINGTNLLNVAGMTRGRRDGILKSEKMRHIVKIGPMPFKGVWIPFERALGFANKEKITELLYPLFVHNIGALLYHPTNQVRLNAVMAATERRKQE